MLLGFDITAQKFGRLLVMNRVANRGRASYWRCICDCGNEVVVRGSSLRQEKTKSCGCIRREAFDEVCHRKGSKKASYLDGRKSNRFYGTWIGMMRRCYDNTRRDYKFYGERGVTVCEEWKNDPFSFFAWCEKQEPIPYGYTIDRYPDNTGPYSPTNCRFASAQQQANNKRPYRPYQSRKGKQ